MENNKVIYYFITPKGSYQIQLFGHGMYIFKKIGGDYMNIITSHCRGIDKNGNIKQSDIFSAIRELLIWELPEQDKDKIYSGEKDLLDFLSECKQNES